MRFDRKRKIKSLLFVFLCVKFSAHEKTTDLQSRSEKENERRDT